MKIPAARKSSDFASASYIESMRADPFHAGLECIDHLL